VAEEAVEESREPVCGARWGGDNKPLDLFGLRITSNATIRLRSRARCAPPTPANRAHCHNTTEPHRTCGPRNKNEASRSYRISITRIRLAAKAKEQPRPRKSVIVYMHCRKHTRIP